MKRLAWVVAVVLGAFLGGTGTAAAAELADPSQVGYGVVCNYSVGLDPVYGVLRVQGACNHAEHYRTIALPLYPEIGVQSGGAWRVLSRVESTGVEVEYLTSRRLRFSYLTEWFDGIDAVTAVDPLSRVQWNYDPQPAWYGTRAGVASLVEAAGAPSYAVPAPASFPADYFAGGVSGSELPPTTTTTTMPPTTTTGVPPSTSTVPPTTSTTSPAPTTTTSGGGASACSWETGGIPEPVPQVCPLGDVFPALEFGVGVLVFLGAAGLVLKVRAQ